MILVKQSTAKTIPVGPFLDSTDGNTNETALTIAQADIRISKNGGAWAQTNNVAGATHQENGYYSVPLNTTDTNTLGHLRISIHVAGALAVWDDVMVLSAKVYDSLIGGTDILQVDLTQMGGVAQSATDLKDFADAGYNPATNKVQGVVLVDTTMANTDMVGTDNALLAASAPANFSDLAITVTTGLVDITQIAADKVWSTATRTLTSFGTLVSDIWANATRTLTGLGSSLVAEIWNALTSGLTTSGSIGKLLVDNVNTTISSRSSHGDPDPSGYIDAAISSRSSHTAAAVVDQVWDEAKAGHVGAGSFGKEMQAHSLSSEVLALNDITAAQVNAEVVDVIKIDTVAEMAQGAPPVSPTIEQILNYLYRMLRDKDETTATEIAVYDDAGTTKLIKAVLSDDGTTFTRGKFESGA